MLEDTIKKYLKRKIKHFDDSQDEKDETINYFRRTRIHWLYLLNVLLKFKAQNNQKTDKQRAEESLGSSA